MKKILILIVVFLLTGCGEKINTCTIKTSEFEQKWKYISKNENVEKIELDISYDNSLFGKIDSFETLTSKEKNVLKNQILSKLGFEKENYPGFDIDIIIDKNINVKVKSDITMVNKELLKKIGLDFNETNINQIIKHMIDNGAICE